MQQDEGIIQHSDLLFGVIDEIRREVAAVKLHALDHIKLVVQGLAVFDGNHAFLAHFFHRLGDDVADFLIGVGGDRAHLGDFFGSRAWLADLFEFFGDRANRFIDAAFEVHRVHAGGNILHALTHDGLSQYGGSRGAITCGVRGLGSHFFHHLCAHVFELIFEFDFFGYRDAVLGDGG